MAASCAVTSALGNNGAYSWAAVINDPPAISALPFANVPSIWLNSV
jgi:hypothetical protein